VLSPYGPGDDVVDAFATTSCAAPSSAQTRTLLCFANIPTVYESPRIADQTHASRVPMTFAPIANSGGLTPSMVAVGSCEPVRIDFQHALPESAARIQASVGHAQHSVACLCGRERDPECKVN